MKTSKSAFASEINGSIGGAVFSHNKQGSYIRIRSRPTNPQTLDKQRQHIYLTRVARAWKTLTQTQRNTWALWAQNHPIRDRIGDLRIMTGQQAYCQINARVYRMNLSTLSDPPTADPPDPIYSLALSFNSADPFNASFTFAAAPLGAQERFWMFGCSPRHPGLKDNSRITRFIGLGPLAAVSPYKYGGYFVGKFGTVQTGQVVSVTVHVINGFYGLLSPPLTAECVAT